jgi:multiple sugar transport system substrate-binding protein
MLHMRASRRDVLRGAASVAAVAAASSAGLGGLTREASAQDDLRAQILQIPGVGKGSPTDADWQKVGELCLGATKTNVAEGEFAGVELAFMGLNNQNLHNVLFRGFLKPWEAYTGAKISWIDLAQADYNPRLQQAIATGTVDFDIIEMGAPFEGDTAGRGLLDEMPDWVKTQIEADDLVGYLQPPVGTWRRLDLRPGRGAEALGRDQCDVDRDQGQDRPADRTAGLRLPRPAEISVGRLRVLLPRGPRRRLCQASG